MRFGRGGGWHCLGMIIPGVHLLSSFAPDETMNRELLYMLAASTIHIYAL